MTAGVTVSGPLGTQGHSTKQALLFLTDFATEEAEAQSNYLTCPDRAANEGAGFRLRQPGPGLWPSSPCCLAVLQTEELRGRKLRELGRH